MTANECGPDRLTAPPVLSVPPVTLPRMAERRLPGGSLLKVYDRGTSPVVEVSVVREGGQAELADQAVGLLYGATLREGSLRYSAAEIAETLDFNGAWLNAGNTAHYHVVKFFTLCKRLPEVLAAVNDIIRHPAFDPAAVELHREAQAKKLEVSLRKVKYLADNEIRKIAYGTGHPLARVTTPEALRSVSREDLLALSASWSGTPTTVYLAGNVTDGVLRQVEDAFGDLPGASVPAFSPVRLSPQLPPVTRRIEVDGATQSAVGMTLPAIPRSHPDYLMLHTAVAALGGYFGSRLMSTVREEKGYTYGITAGLVGQIDGAYISIGAECDPRFVEPLVAEVRAEMSRLASEPPAGEELERLKQAMAASLLEVLETPFTVAEYHATMLMQGIPEGYFDRRVRLLLDLTSEQIADVAERYLRPENMSVVVAG